MIQSRATRFVASAPAWSSQTVMEVALHRPGLDDVVAAEAADLPEEAEDLGPVGCDRVGQPLGLAVDADGRVHGAPDLVEPCEKFEPMPAH